MLESVSINDRQGTEICENVGKTLVEELDNEDVWSKVEDSLSDYLKSNNIKEDASTLIDKLEWSVRVTLKK
ncbi:MAG: hypothetical protein ACFCUE_06145 [Candidatus Bathyarchaeia archaeon]|jgi:hypothetical protein